jgi:hypothetical protein
MIEIWFLLNHLKKTHRRVKQRKRVEPCKVHHGVSLGCRFSTLNLFLSQGFLRTWILHREGSPVCVKATPYSSSSVLDRTRTLHVFVLPFFFLPVFILSEGEVIRHYGGRPAREGGQTLRIYSQLGRGTIGAFGFLRSLAWLASNQPGWKGPGHVHALYIHLANCMTIAWTNLADDWLADEIEKHVLLKHQHAPSRPSEPGSLETDFVFVSWEPGPVGCFARHKPGQSALPRNQSAQTCTPRTRLEHMQQTQRAPYVENLQAEATRGVGNRGRLHSTVLHSPRISGKWRRA